MRSPYIPKFHQLFDVSPKILSRGKWSMQSKTQVFVLGNANDHNIGNTDQLAQLGPILNTILCIFRILLVLLNMHWKLK